MAGKNVPVVLIPCWSTFVGEGAFALPPIPCAAYEGLVLSSMWGPMSPSGGSTSVGLVFEESNDLEDWSNCLVGAYPTTTPFTEIQSTATLTKAWFRLRVVLNGRDAAVTGWAQGFFILRER